MTEFPVPHEDTFQRLTIPEGTVIHDIRCFPLRIWRASRVYNWSEEISFDAICVFNGGRIQGYSLKRTDKLPPHWHVITNEMHLIALSAMDREEYWAWFEKQTQTQTNRLAST